MSKAPAVLLASAVLGVGTHSAAQDEYPIFDEPGLRKGREVWLETCRACHMTDIAGAPQVTDAEAWRPRMQQRKEILYEHALNGLHGEKGTEMPPRGGNAALSDDEVRAAVEYMLALVSNLSGE